MHACLRLKQCIAFAIVLALLVAQTPLPLTAAQKGNRALRRDGGWTLDVQGDTHGSAVVNGERDRAHRSSQTGRDPVDILLVETHYRIQRHIEVALDEIRREFAKARRRNPQFTEKMLSWRWKWRCIKAHATGNKRQFERAVMREFESTVISAPAIQRAVRAAVAKALARIQEEEDRLLIALRADTDLPIASQLSQISIEELRNRYAQAIRQIASDTGSQVAKDLRNQAIITAVILMIEIQIQRVLTTSGIIAAAGLGSVWWTFGLLLVIGLLVDWAYGKIYDAPGRLARAVNRTLGRAEAAVLFEVRTSLRRFETERHGVRVRAIRRVLQELRLGTPDAPIKARQAGHNR